MTERVTVGVWCGDSKELLAPIQHETPLLRWTMRRLGALGELYALVPWAGPLDHLAAEVGSWGFLVRRTSPDKRIAMRDLVAERGADYGCLVDGACAVIDRAEVHLAIARLRHNALTPDVGPGTEGLYHSSRLVAMTAARWLALEDKEAWPEPMKLKAAARFFDGKSEKTNAREMKARAAEDQSTTG